MFILIALAILPVALLPISTSVPVLILILFAMAEVALFVAVFRLGFTMRVLLAELAGFFAIALLAIFASQLFASTPPILDANGEPIPNSNDRICYDFALRLAQKRGDTQQVEKLKRQGSPPYYGNDVALKIAAYLTDLNNYMSKNPAIAKSARIIVLTTYDSDEDIYRGLQAGAKGYLLKETEPDELLNAICTVHRGQQYIPSDVGAKLAQRLSNPELTERELAVLRSLAQGMNNAEIADALSIGEGTVKSHVNRILNKLDVSDRTQAVIVAVKRGIVSL